MDWITKCVIFSDLTQEYNAFDGPLRDLFQNLNIDLVLESHTFLGDRYLDSNHRLYLYRLSNAGLCNCFSALLHTDQLPSSRVFHGFRSKILSVIPTAR